MGSFLYSIQTHAALILNRKYYGSVHWVCCTDCENFKNQASLMSSPSHLYKDFSLASESNERIPIFDNHTKGLKRGIEAKLAGQQELAAQVSQAVNRFEPRHLKPVLLVIDRRKIDERRKAEGKKPLSPLKPHELTEPLSDEYLIEDLREGEFDELHLPTQVGVEKD